MKPTKLIIKNIGKIADESIDINQPLILFYGEIKQGKTTILNCVRWICGGEFPDDIISHGAKDGLIELHFDGGMISRSFYRAKDLTTKARPVVFVKNGKPVQSPVAEIKRLLNPFLLDQDFLRNKTELERKQYFTELFAVDTTALDTELFNSQRDAATLRAKISGYGEIDLTPVHAVNIAGAQSELQAIKSEYATQKAALETEFQSLQDGWQAACEATDKKNQAINEANSKVDQSTQQARGINSEIERLQARIVELQNQLKGIEIGAKSPLYNRPAAPDRAPIQQKLLEIVPDTSKLEKLIQDAGATNVKAGIYAQNKARAEQKRLDEESLAAMEKRQREIKAEKQTKLQTISQSSGIKGLSFDESGNFIYDDTTAGMISDSQIMRLSSELSALYPDGFGLDLIDRAESLGKSIFEFVDKAKAENKSILATIVGERPAKVPADIGVFVVNDGKISE